MSGNPCGAKTRNGGTCKLMPAPGATRCRLHGGASPNAIAKAAERLADQAAARELARIGRKRDVHPAEALLELVQWQAGLVDYWRAEVADLEAEDLTWGKTREKVGGDDRGTTYEAAPHIAYTLLVQAQDKLADYASRALKAGVEERRVRVAEQTGQLVAEVIRAILSELNLTSEQQHLVGEVVPKHLRRLAAVA
jgi:hypothetical protein